VEKDKIVNHCIVGKKFLWHWLCLFCGDGNATGSQYAAEKAAQKHVCRS